MKSKANNLFRQFLPSDSALLVGPVDAMQRQCLARILNKPDISDIGCQIACLEKGCGLASFRDIPDVAFAASVIASVDFAKETIPGFAEVFTDGNPEEFNSAVNNEAYPLSLREFLQVNKK